MKTLAKLLIDSGDKGLAAMVNAAASGTDEELNVFLTSNELWGGAGSVADQAGMNDGLRTNVRRSIERAMIELGEEQIRLAQANVRTASWVAAFKKWAKDGI